MRTSHVILLAHKHVQAGTGQQAATTAAMQKAIYYANAKDYNHAKYYALAALAYAAGTDHRDYRRARK
jgi:hypothetical protein